jgi:hypothetical protein
VFKKIDGVCRFASLYFKLAHVQLRRDECMKELLSAGILFVVLSVTLMIGGAMIAKTENITLTLAPGNTLITQLATDTGSALTTLTSLLPIVALALVGGLAIFYLLSTLSHTFVTSEMYGQTFMGRSSA